MKALVLERRGSKAVLLLPGGEMRTVRAKKDWQTGMKVSVKPYPRPKKKRGSALRAVFYPAAAFAAALVIVMGGLSLLGGDHIDRQHPVQPLASGAPAAESASPEPVWTPSPAPTDAPTATPSPSPTPTSSPTQQPVQPTPGRQERCDECGQTGHDDDHCPNERCDECGKYGHDDDHCPNQRCDECGKYGHDDDDCPDQICEECGQRGHDDDDCDKKHGGRHHDD